MFIFSFWTLLARQLASCVAHILYMTLWGLFGQLNVTYLIAYLFLLSDTYLQHLY